LKLSKCSFACNEIKYVGFKISKKGIRSDEINLEIIQKFPKPTTIRELRSLIGCVSYFRRFIKGFAKIIKPLYDLTGDVWTEKQDNAFKLILSNSFHLQYWIHRSSKTVYYRNGCKKNRSGRNSLTRERSRRNSSNTIFFKNM
jgi:hypothetical protein